MTEPFNFPDGRAASNAKELLELCEQYPDAATGFLVRHDLENWLAYIGNYDVAECAANARQIEAEDRQKLEDFLNKCHSLNSPTSAPAAAPESQLENNLIPPDTTITEAEVATLQEKPFQGVSIQETPATKTPVPEAELATATAPARKPAAKAPVSPSSTNGSEKPSFFQVIAKLIVKVLYRNKG